MILIKVSIFSIIRCSPKEWDERIARESEDNNQKMTDEAGKESED